MQNRLMKISNNHYAFLTSAVCGFILWYFSEEIMGNAEPWDGNLLVYVIALTAIGFLCVYLFGSNLSSVYWGGFLGQAALGAAAFFGCLLLGFFCRGAANLFPLGVVFLLVYSLPLLLGAWAAAAIRRRRIADTRI
jgi:hypothetical protein